MLTERLPAQGCCRLLGLMFLLATGTLSIAAEPAEQTSSAPAQAKDSAGQLADLAQRWQEAKKLSAAGQPGKAIELVDSIRATEERMFGPASVQVVDNWRSVGRLSLSSSDGCARRLRACNHARL